MTGAAVRGCSTPPPPGDGPPRSPRPAPRMGAPAAPAPRPAGGVSQLGPAPRLPAANRRSPFAPPLTSASHLHIAPRPLRRHRALQPPGRRAPLLQSLRGARGGGERAPPRPPPNPPLPPGPGTPEHRRRRGRPVGIERGVGAARQPAAIEAAAGGGRVAKRRGGDWELRGGPRVRSAAGGAGGGAGWGCGRQCGGRQEGTGRGTAVPTLPPPPSTNDITSAPPSYGSARCRALHAAPISVHIAPTAVQRCAVLCPPPPPPQHPPVQPRRARCAGARLQVPFCRGTAGAAAAHPAGLRAPLRAAAVGRCSRQR